MRKDSQPIKGKPAKASLRKSDVNWDHMECETIDKDSGEPCIQVKDETDVTGDQFECA